MTTPPPFRGSSSPLTRQQLRSRRYARVSRDVYVLADRQRTYETACDAALLALPDAVLSHATAALLHRLPVPATTLVHLNRASTAGASRRAGVVTHRGPLPTDDVVEQAGRRLTSPVRTWLDLARSLPPVPLIALGDAVARRSGLPSLQAAVAAAAGQRGVARARAALARVDPGADSAAETAVRLLLHDAGFTALRHGVRILDDLGGWLATADLGDPDAKVAVQYDGLVHLHRGPEQWRRDIDRDELSRVAGWQVVVLTAYDVRQPERAVLKVAHAYDRSAGRG